MQRPRKPGRTVRRAKVLRRKLTPPEILLWRELKGSPGGIRFRKQHPAGDSFSTFSAPARTWQSARDAWLRVHRIDTLRIPAADVFRDGIGVAQAIVSYVEERLQMLGKAPPSAAGAAATSPSQVDGEEFKV